MDRFEKALQPHAAFDLRFIFTCAQRRFSSIDRRFHFFDNAYWNTWVGGFTVTTLRSVVRITNCSEATTGQSNSC